MAKKRTIELVIAGYTFCLKNLKVHDDMSDETTCFTADLYCNGKKIAYCKNDGRGGMTDVCAFGNDPHYDLYCEAMKAIISVRDTEYEKEMDEHSKQYAWYNGKPWVQKWSDDHLAERLMYKQSAWDDAVKQIKKFARKFPLCNIWFDGHVMEARLPSEDAKMVKQGYENVTQWVR